jgi:hypothetical protein
MDRFRRIFPKHPINDEKIPLISKQQKKTIGQKVTSGIKRKGYKPIQNTRGDGRRRRKRASAIKAKSRIRSAIGLKRRKSRRRRKMYK